MDRNINQFGWLHRGASDGLIFGLYLTALFLLSANSLAIPSLSLPSMVLMCGIPFLTYFYLYKGYKQEFGTTTFSALWMQGIVMFFCGSMIMALVIYLFMRWIHPSFLVDFLTTARDLYDGMDWDNGKQMAQTIDTMIDNHLVPAPITIAIQSMLMCTFFGSILSIFCSLIIGALRPRHFTKS
jgi:hypothetical protein